MHAKELKCKVAGIGAWGNYFDSWQALQALLNGDTLPDSASKGPKPAVIPANERRRAPLPVRLAVESSWQATQSANVSPDALTCVFVSGLGDTDLTDYMCRTLASEHKELSPTKFHNSVHNAPAGYWTISTHTMSAANSVAGYQQSVSLALLEAIIQCESEGVPVLVTFYDAPVADVLQPILSNQQAFAFSLIIYPDAADIEGVALSVTVQNTPVEKWPTLRNTSDYISSLYSDNPSARVLCLAEIFSQPNNNATIAMPLSKATSIAFNCV
ncbi:beta-ketoacyl synthase chain length factor [Alteromonas sp. H39]|uniref:beta-ketoacyl synthase chain length factor n=1 Tax=Alteromonas sp. H39 TaxID=3389876 RepID=UPI0039DF5DCD